ncbi:hypothetical protein ASPSYDRAFT_47459 [Aspergillus sydowii CBS 593.65]|uniref:Uncharacterized protein n=1 Tax=Aspergillus sydowii CBS 593.65 TaxID=1036612 RepID=A0A1L9TCK5_9EURO|nr:uncharacterized protein ASPSYDRAFT_47459 [Aspergillus sydowii CBS 593.65]OJJ57164.1 hypothetical protein ASPSYDRAFT_47459 [Aspergillus sydowii CBS 593.65]
MDSRICLKYKVFCRFSVILSLVCYGVLYKYEWIYVCRPNSPVKYSTTIVHKLDSRKN